MDRPAELGRQEDHRQLDDRVVDVACQTSSGEWIRDAVFRSVGKRTSDKGKSAGGARLDVHPLFRKSLTTRLFRPYP